MVEDGAAEPQREFEEERRHCWGRLSHSFSSEMCWGDSPSPQRDYSCPPASGVSSITSDQQQMNSTIKPFQWLMYNCNTQIRAGPRLRSKQSPLWTTSPPPPWKTSRGFIQNKSTLTRVELSQSGRSFWLNLYVDLLWCVALNAAAAKNHGSSSVSWYSSDHGWHWVIYLSVNLPE